MTTYKLNEMTEITQYNVEDVYKDGSETEKAFGNPKTYVPVFHGLQPKPGEGGQPIKIELEEGHVEIGGPTLEPWDTEEYDDQILAQSGQERNIHPDAISVYPTSDTVKLANPLITKDIVATVTPATSEFPITWKATPSGKVTIEETGTPGKVTIKPVDVAESVTVTATTGAVSASADIKVEKVGVSSVSITEPSIVLAPNSNQTLTLSINPGNAYNSDVTWSSSDEEVATVDQSGKVTAVADGSEVATATITATSDDDNTKNDTCTVTVKIAVTGVELDESAISLAPNATKQLTATVSPDDATVSTVNRSSSDEAVATVEDGLVTAVADGNATITATCTDDITKIATCTVTVETPSEEPGE